MRRVSNCLDTREHASQYIRWRRRRRRLPNGNGLPPETAVALKAKLVQAETEAKIREEAAKQKMQHKDEQFRQRMEQTTAKDQLANAQRIRSAQVDESATDLKTAAEIQRQQSEPPTTATE